MEIFVPVALAIAVLVIGFPAWVVVCLVQRRWVHFAATFPLGAGTSLGSAAAGATVEAILGRPLEGLAIWLVVGSGYLGGLALLVWIANRDFGAPHGNPPPP